MKRGGCSKLPSEHHALSSTAFVRQRKPLSQLGFLPMLLKLVLGIRECQNTDHGEMEFHILSLTEATKLN